MTEQVFDWNWFFAAFAQCGAALIGIIAAFIISKIIGEIEREEKFSDDLNKLFNEYNDILKKINYRSFHWHDRLTIKYCSKIKNAIEDFQHLELISDEQKMEFLLKIQPNLYGTEDCLPEFEERIEEIEKTLGSQFPIIPSLPPNGLWDDINEEREIINDLKIQSESMIEKFKHLKGLNNISKMKLEPIKNVIWILVFGFIITVIYPLHFMPLNLNETPRVSLEFSTIVNNLFSLKGLLIISLTLVIEGILIYFIYLIKGINTKYEKNINRIKAEHVELSKYCEYFKN